MKVAVFGAAGFIGRNFVRTLQSKGVGVVASDVAESPFGADIDYKVANILDFETVSKIVASGDYVVDLAASPLQISLSQPRLNVRVNIEGTLNLLDASRSHGIKKFVFASASSVIGTVRYNPVDEDHPCAPRTPYAVAKKACEDYLRVYGELYDLNFVVFRLFNVYGPWQSSSSGAIIPRIYEKIKAGNTVEVFGNGQATRDYVYVDDVSEFLYKAVSSDVNNEIVNLGTGKGSSVLGLIGLAAEMLGIEPRIAFTPNRLGEIDNFVADTSKLQRLFYCTPTTVLEEGLKKTFQWLSDVR